MHPTLPVRAVRRSTILPWCLAVAAAAACDDGADRPADVPSDGVAALTLEEVDRIGSVEGPDALGAVTAVARGENEIFVVESRPPRVLRYTDRGERLGTFAREGDGPGELRQPWNAGVTEGVLWIADARAGELEVFEFDGEPMSTLGLGVPADSGGTPAVPRGLLQGGAVLLGPGGFGIGSVVTGTIDHHTFYRVHGDGDGPRVVVRVPVPSTDFVMAEMSGGRALMGAHPLQEGQIAGVFPDGSGLVVVDRWQAATPDSASWRMRVWDAAGELETDVVVPYRPVSAEGWQERQRRQMIERSGPDADLEGLEEMIGALQGAWDERAYVPPVTRVEPGYGGTILVRREDTGIGEVAWDRFDRQGRHTGRFVTDGSLAVMAVEGDELWALVTGELDVPSVVRYRLTED